MIREYFDIVEDLEDFEDCRHDASNFTCFLAEFNIQYDKNEKMQNGRTLEESLNDAMLDLKVDTSLIIQPKEPSERTKPRGRNDQNTGNLETVRILNRIKKTKVPSIVIPFVVGTVTCLIFAYT